MGKEKHGFGKICFVFSEREVIRRKQKQKKTGRHKEIRTNT